MSKYTQMQTINVKLCKQGFQLTKENILIIFVYKSAFCMPNTHHTHKIAMMMTECCDKILHFVHGTLYAFKTDDLHCDGDRLC